MFTNADEAAYCTMRIARSTALARASADSCARASHAGIAAAYQLRLSSLVRTSDASILQATPAGPVARETEAPAHPDPEMLRLRALLRWDNEGGAVAADPRRSDQA